MAKLSKKQKIKINQRAAGRCEYCQTPANYSPSPFPSEHIQPSPTGTITIEVLKLNREGLVNLRFALLAIGTHPPNRK